MRPRVGRITACHCRRGGAAHSGCFLQLDRLRAAKSTTFLPPVAAQGTLAGLTLLILGFAAIAGSVSFIGCHREDS